MAFFRLIERLVFRQERRPYSFYTIFAFSVFVGVFRGLEESLFLGQNLKNSNIALLIIFYLSIGFYLAMILTLVGRIYWKRVVNAVIIGIFLGLFPPVIDLLFFSWQKNIFYGYFYFNEPGLAPWFFYAPEHHSPIGEAITVWASILFCCLYVYIKTRSPLRSLAALAGAYLVFYFQAIVLPTQVFNFTVGEIQNQADLANYGQFQLRQGMFYLALWQLLFMVIAYLAIRWQLAFHLAKRFLHALPFVIICLLGASVTSALNTDSYLVAAAIGIACLAALVQNDYYDRHDDKYSNRKSVVEKTDIPFFNITILLLAAVMFMMSNRAALALLIFMTVTMLYNYPFYRAKKSFPGNLKIEGIWGLSSYMAGMLIFDESQISNASLVIALLVFGGWSLVASLKDLKDLRADRAAGSVSLYLWLRKKGISLKRSHLAVSIAVIMAFLFPLAYFSAQGLVTASLVLFLSTVAPLAYLLFTKQQKHTFRYQLILISIYLVQVLAISETTGVL